MVLTVRITDEEHQTLINAAADAGMKLSPYIRSLLFAKEDPDPPEPKPVIQKPPAGTKPMCGNCKRKGPPNTYCSECGHCSRLPSKWMQ